MTGRSCRWCSSSETVVSLVADAGCLFATLGCAVSFDRNSFSGKYFRSMSSRCVDYGEVIRKQIEIREERASDAGDVFTWNRNLFLRNVMRHPLGRSVKKCERDWRSGTTSALQVDHQTKRQSTQVATTRKFTSTSPARKNHSNERSL